MSEEIKILLICMGLKILDGQGKLDELGNFQIKKALKHPNSGHF